MRYILNNEGYIEEISFSNEIECNSKTCVEYTGVIPSGYSSLLEWSEFAIIQAYKITDGNLTYDPDKETVLKSEWATQEAKCKSEMVGNKVTSVSESSTDIEYPSAKCLYDSLNNKVDKTDGKGLSTNDYTTAEKEKLAGLNNYTLPTATTETLGGVKVGAGLTINSGVLSATGGGMADSVDWSNVQNKPTKVSDFTNDAGYQTSDQVNDLMQSVFGEGLKYDIMPPYDFTEEDITKVSNYSSGTGTLTEEEKEKYDLNKDGVINIADILNMQDLMNTKATTTEPALLEINSKNPLKTLLIQDNEGEQIVNISLLGINTKNLEIDSVNIKDLFFPIDSVYITSTNESPASFLDGTWELIDKGFKEEYVNDTAGELFTMNTTNISSYQVALTRNGSSIRIRFYCTLKVNVEDTSVIVGNLNYANIGITRITSGYQGMASGNDAGNCIFVYDVSYNTGEIKITDVVGKTENKIPSGTTIYADFTFTNNFAYMLDDACDKFYWKRTA